MLGNPANKYLTCILRMRLRHNKHAHPRMPQLTQLSAVEVVAHHGHDHVFRLIAAVHVSNGMVVVLCVRLVPSARRETSRVSGWLAGWWLSCGCVSGWSTIKSQLSQLQEEYEEVIKQDEAMIDKQIIATPTEHVRGVTRIFGMPGEGFPRAERSRLVLTVCTRRCKAPIRDGRNSLRS